MLMKGFFIFLGTYTLLTIIVLPIQYRYLLAIHREMEETNMSQDEYYESLLIQEEVYHANSQKNPLFIPANIIAWLILKWQNKL